MIGLVALAWAASAEPGSLAFRAGAWEGRCARRKMSRCIGYEAVSSGPVTLRFKRDSLTALLSIEPADCAPPQIWRSINPAYSARTLTYMLRGHVVSALSACKSKLPVPDLQSADTAELFRQTEIVKN